MKSLMTVMIVFFLSNVCSAQIPYETRAIQRSGNRETYIGNRGYLGHSVVRGNTRVYSDKKGVYSKQYVDGAGTTRIRPLSQRGMNARILGNNAVAGNPARSAASRGFNSSK